MDSRTRMEKVYEVKFTTATSGDWEHATRLWAAGTFSASLAPPQQARPSPPRPQRPASLPPATRAPAPGYARTQRTGARAGRAGPKSRARSRARQTRLRMRQGVGCARAKHEWLGCAFRPMRAPAPVFCAFLSQDTRNRLTCKFPASDPLSLLREDGNPFLLCKPPS